MRTDNLIINGYGSSNGGEFHKVQLNGKGTVNGNVECEQFECNGYGAVTGDLKSNSARISGSGKVDGTVHAETMRIDGESYNYAKCKGKQFENCRKRYDRRKCHR